MKEKIKDEDIGPLTKVVFNRKQNILDASRCSWDVTGALPGSRCHCACREFTTNNHDNLSLTSWRSKV